MPASKAQQAFTANRRKRAIGMLLAGVDYESIAKELDYSSRGAASKDVCRALDLYRKELADNAANYRAQQLMRLDRVLAAVWPKVLKGDLKAAEAARRIIADQSKVLGVNEPIRAELTGPGGGPISFTTGDMDEFEALLAAGDTPTSAAPDNEPDDDHGD